MLTPIVFLDFDGVLNHFTHFVGLNHRVAADCLTDALSFDHAAVARLNVIVERTGAEVVISSSWRTRHDDSGALAFPLPVLRSLLERHGFRGRVADITPRLHRSPDGEPRVRGHEIQAWIDAQPAGTVGPFVVLDDDADMAHLEARTVRTSMDTGLLDEHVERAVALLVMVSP